MSIASDLVRDLESEARKAREVLATVPEEKLAWKPHAKSMSLGTLAGHVAENPSWISAMLEDEMDFDSMKDYRPFEPKTSAELLAGLDKNLADGVAAIRGRSDAELLRTWTMRKGEEVLMSLPKHEAIRGTGIHHWIHHRGQLTVYLRLLDVPVPQTYGPTADRPAFA